MVHRRRKADPIGAGPPEQREVTMYRPQAQSALLLGAALLAACSDRNTPTARLAGPLAATATLADRPYTWTLTWGNIPTPGGSTRPVPSRRPCRGMRLPEKEEDSALRKTAR